MSKYKIGSKVTSWKGNVGEDGIVIEILKSAKEGILYKVELNDNRGSIYDKAKNLKQIKDNG